MKLKTSQLFTASLLSAVMFSAHAANTNQSTNVESESTQSRQTQTEERHFQWGLSENEFSRYEKLMEGVRGSISPDSISPIEVLGIHARTASEREKYARMWADMMEKDAERILAFQRAYDEVWKEKGGDIIDISAIRSQPATSALSQANNSLPKGESRTLTLLTKLESCSECDQKINTLLTSLMVDKSLQLNVYFSDSENKPTSMIRQWAVKNGVQPELLKSKRITINHGSSIMKKHQITENQLPVVYK